MAKDPSRVDFPWVLSHAYRTGALGVSRTFESDGSSIAVGVDGSSRTLGKCPPGDISTLVNEALLKALATYYSKWEGLQQRWR